MKLNIAVLMFIFLTVCADSRKDYFPEWEALNSIERAWFSRHLSAARESPITLPIEGEVYRFTWLRSFHPPIAVRVTCAEKCVLSAKQLSGAGGYSAGRIRLEEERELKKEEIKELRLIAKVLDEWVNEPDKASKGLDGAQWILEMATGRQYRAWNLWSPSGEGAAKVYVDMCVYLLKLTSSAFDKGDVY